VDPIVQTKKPPILATPLAANNPFPEPVFRGMFFSAPSPFMLAEGDGAEKNMPRFVPFLHPSYDFYPPIIQLFISDFYYSYSVSPVSHYCIRP
jgi:hypothetical protein